MYDFFRILRSEALKFVYSRATRIILLLVFGLQTLLAFVSGKQILSIGLDATPETCPELLEAMPPLEYMGFDTVSFSTVLMIVLGAVYGANEFKHHSMRTTLLCAGARSRVFFAKSICIAFASFVISFLSVLITISVTHAVFGDQGLCPVILNTTVWKFILYATVALTMLTMISYLLGFLFRTGIIPMLFLIVQAYNIGNMLAERFVWARLLPVSLVNRLIASSESTLTLVPAWNICVLLLWIGALGVAAFLRFRNTEMQGGY